MPPPSAAAPGSAIARLPDHQTPDKYWYDVIFLRKPLAVTEAMRESILAA